VALRQGEVVAHADLIPVVEDGCPWQREHEAVGELETLALAEHRRQPPADAAVVQLHQLLGAEALEDRRPLLLRQPPEVELVVVAKELRPLRRGR
jgi:hypothetical protein